MTPTLTVLLCLASDFLPGTLPKPTLWAEPDSLITWGSPVTMWCQGTLGAKEYRLEKDGRLVSRDTEKPLEPGNKAKFNIPSMTEHHAGRYHCYYYSPDGWSEHSDPLELVVTGSYHSKPTLSALPSPVVTTRGKVTLQCGSQEGFRSFILIEEGEHKLSWTRDSQQSSYRQFRALFPVGPVTPSHRWTFRCYGYYRNSPQVWSEPSDPLELLISGKEFSSYAVHFLRPQRCRWEPCFQGIWRWKGGVREQRLLGPQAQTVRDSGTCPGEVSAQTTTHPSCLSLGQLPDTPSLSAQPGPMVASGEDVTLLCQSSSRMDTFLLTKEGAANPPLRQRSKYKARRYQAEFSMSPVTSAHGGTYRCYSSLSSSPYLLSLPSDPLELVVSVGLCQNVASPSSSPPLLPVGTPPQDYTVENLIRMGMAGLILVALGMLLFQDWHSQRRHQDAAGR
uniref:Ig-like domain-containing protein n=1 Tax=Propithecus coquereli TaxID=379532 RepID=A0A2K6GK72_PROCO